LVCNSNDWITCRWEKTTGEGRYYLVLLHQDLWGQWIVTRVWGGRRRKAGQSRHLLVHSREEGIQELKKIAERRAARQYQITKLSGDPDEMAGLALGAFPGE
jgi:hypothetical protein